MICGSTDNSLGPDEAESDVSADGASISAITAMYMFKIFIYVKISMLIELTIKATF